MRRTRRRSQQQGMFNRGRKARPSKAAAHSSRFTACSGNARPRRATRHSRKVDRHKALAYVEVAMPSGPALLRAALAVVSRT